jgi:uncharacterized protein YjbI with pentapeptide repeats
VRDILNTGQGAGTSYVGLNLKGAFLEGADLSRADLSDADLTGASLKNANLRGANLTKVQALGVEFESADLTGACLESWNIDSTTQLKGSHADYVFLLKNFQERRPASGSFGEGEFAKLFQEVLDTVDFIFNNGIDWQAFMVTFDELREKVRVECEDGDVTVQSIENKGDGVFVVKVQVPLQTDKGEFHSQFTENYENQVKLLEARYQAQLEGKEQQIALYREQNINLMEIIKTQAAKPITIQNIANAKSGNREMNIHGNISDSILASGDKNVIEEK